MEMIADELKIVPEVLGSDIGIWMELIGNENDEFAKSEGKLVGIVDEVDGGKSILGCKWIYGWVGSSISIWCNNIQRWICSSYYCGV